MVALVAGARPNFMKIAPIIGALKAAESRVIDVIAHEPSPTLKQELNAIDHIQR